MYLDILGIRVEVYLQTHMWQMLGTSYNADLKTLPFTNHLSRLRDGD